MRRRVALVLAIATGVVALTPAVAGAQSSSNLLCFKHPPIQIGLCP